MDVDLAQPEFDGLWDKQPAKQEIDPLFNRSKHWKTKMDKVMSKQKPKKFINKNFLSKGYFTTNIIKIKRKYCSRASRWY
jgi:hypothetical protein